MIPAISQLGRLVRAEGRLFLREPLSMTFVVALPVITVLVLGGSFARDDPAFQGAAPSDYYVAAYFGVVIAAVGLVMLPVHIASYDERRVLDRFDVAGMPRWLFPLSQFVLGLAFVAAGGAAVVVTALLSYGVPTVTAPGGVVLGVVVGAAEFVSIGVLLGSVLRNARAAQGVGLLLFFPMFLLGGGGPPSAVMPAAMRTVADALPLTYLIRTIQNPWLGLGESVTPLLVDVAVGLVATVFWVRRSRAVARR
jgi:ABC-2 type transport system permease protein